MKKNYQAIVIGGGYFGCSSAYNLAKASISTLLLEKNEITSGASGANFGCVQVQDASPGLSLELTLAGFAKMKTMEKELNRDIGFNLQGSLIAAEYEHHLPELQQLYQTMRGSGLNIQWLEGERLYQMEPNLKNGSIRAATYFEQGRIYPFHYMYAQIARGKEYGLDVAENTAVAELLMENGKCTGVILVDGNAIRAEQIVITAGAWTRELCKKAGLDVPVYSVKAEAFVTEAIEPFLRNYYSSAGFFAEAHSQESAAMSLCIGQSHYGNLLIGETSKPENMVSADLADNTSMEHCRRVKQKVAEFFPALENIKILRSWVTASPYTDTCLPVFGKSAIPGLIVAAGFKSCAVISPMVGEIIADLVARDSCKYDLSEFIGQSKLL
ncbi:MAG: FAD-dependent oxidoreductase [Clostridia bacterium]